MLSSQKAKSSIKAAELGYKVARVAAHPTLRDTGRKAASYVYTGLPAIESLLPSIDYLREVFLSFFYEGLYYILS